MGECFSHTHWRNYWNEQNRGRLVHIYINCFIISMLNINKPCIQKAILRPIIAWLFLGELRARLNISSVLPFECVLDRQIDRQTDRYIDRLFNTILHRSPKYQLNCVKFEFIKFSIQCLSKKVQPFKLKLTIIIGDLMVLNCFE